MNESKLRKEYFEWIYNLVCNDRYYKNLSYRKLLYFLFNIEFTYTNDKDANRAEDGKDFRYKFAFMNGYSSKVVEEYLNQYPCSVLEMMVALAYRVEDHIMDDPELGDRTGQWFWAMIVSLGLGGVSDTNFSRPYVKQVITRFLNKDYAANGEGGLFTVNNCPYDLRTMEIWDQFMWYLDDIIEN